MMLSVVATLALSTSAAPAPADGPPVAVFAELDGIWRGTFVGYDAAGKELYRLEVEQEYRTIDDHTQQVRLRDTDSKGQTVTGKGRNVARWKDGELILECIVEKSNGDRVVHEGRLVRGPQGETELIWFSRKKGRVETFRERVQSSEQGDVYAIDGMGVYGETPILMAGRYRRVKPSTP
ncbi:MAG: hypothetical protein AAFU79_20200 [Myxococcota bacterium]